MTYNLKVDLTLLKKLTEELELALKTSQTIRDVQNPKKEDIYDFIVDMSKGAGLASGIMQEASALIMDIMNEIKAVQTGPSNADLEKILGLAAPEKAGGYGGGFGGGFGGGGIN